MPPPLQMLLALLLAPLLGRVAANTPLSDAVVNASLAASDLRGYEIAMASRPMWHFASMRPMLYTKDYEACYPTAALNAAGQQHGTEPNNWPDAATGCVSAGPPGVGNPFPTYWTVTRCGDNELRVVYSLYFQHDGFSNLLIAKGHSA